jgi:hypothetical protein
MAEVRSKKLEARYKKPEVRCQKQDRSKKPDAEKQMSGYRQ